MSRGASLSVGRAGVGITIPKSSALPWNAGWTVKDSDFCCGSQVISARCDGCVTSRSSAAKYEHAAQASAAISALSSAAHLASLFMVMSSRGGRAAWYRPAGSIAEEGASHDAVALRARRWEPPALQAPAQARLDLRLWLAAARHPDAERVYFRNQWGPDMNPKGTTTGQGWRAEDPAEPCVSCRFGRLLHGRDRQRRGGLEERRARAELPRRPALLLPGLECDVEQLAELLQRGGAEEAGEHS